MTETSRHIRVEVERQHEVTFLTAEGVLDGYTYRSFRDTLIKAALDEPRVVIVDVNSLSAPAPTAWSVFTSARWHVSVWPDVPILLVCNNTRCRRVLANGVARYVPVHPTREAALDAVHDLTLYGRRRARAQLPAARASLGLARAMVREWLTAWDKTELIPTAATVATVFVDNVLVHTESAPALIAESHRDTITVAVEDGSQHPAARHEDADHGADVVAGLSIVAALSRVWGSTPTSSGKTVWALIGPEGQL
ncbi:STAS domain-containing protein [Mycobacterium vicinigordonae]|uniref:STAS domain-containing protein n=1 Tax=Mycobacterium vicinigordonae TaxID=1719132 RepID=A0A7D6HXN9_9MYCO|nr:STAS domain-containing protein [Mycobacterium vicinigordonae]QLL07175.1 STAS domain-containing protein [Mycobacterium vicinigordonae]